MLSVRVQCSSELLVEQCFQGFDEVIGEQLQRLLRLD